ncbi:MAG: nucleotidyltransferase family protein [Eubacterium sp.]|nr:nucleotidyltransferase family protein [Eubacterium sp.]
MKYEEKFLITACRAYLNGETVKIHDGADLGFLLSLAAHHNLLGVLWCSLEKGFNERFEKALKNSFIDYVFTAERQNLVLTELEGIMEECSARYLLFKGAVLRELYPVKESRAMGDIDLLIKKGDIKKAEAALKAHGFECTAPNGAVHDFQKYDVLLEVHNTMLEDYGEKAFDTAFENAEFNGVKGVLEADFHLAYLIAHMAHHIKYYGAGIRLVLDMAVLQKAFEINYDKVFAELEKLNLSAFGKNILTVCSRWFGVGTNFGGDTNKLEEYLVSSGVFGSLSDNKSAVLTRRELEEGKSVSPLMTRLRLAFPSYEKLRRLKYIGFIDKRPYLTPAAWVYRFVYTAKHRRSFTKKAISNLGDNNTLTEAENQLKFFEEIGL